MKNYIFFILVLESFFIFLSYMFVSIFDVERFFCGMFISVEISMSLVCGSVDISVEISM